MFASEASGLADRGVLYTDKFPWKQACVEKIEADEGCPCCVSMTESN